MLGYLEDQVKAGGVTSHSVSEGAVRYESSAPTFLFSFMEPPRNAGALR